MDEIVGDFVAESRENLDKVEEELLQLEKDPRQPARIASIFRAIHTVKGTCGFLDLHQLEKVAHAGENLLSLLRDGVLAFTSEHATIMLDLVDAIRSMIQHVEATGKDGDEPYVSLIGRLDAMSRPDAPKAAEAPVPASAAQAEGAHKPTATTDAAPKRTVLRRKKRNFGKPRPGAHDSTPPTDDAEPESTHSKSAPETTTSTAAAPPVQPAAPHLAAAPEPATPPPQPKAATTIRVDVAVLDSLMNLVGELVLARNQLLELTSQDPRGALTLTCQRINQVTSELQGNVMKTRMQPISTVWNKFPRVARELGVQCGKRVRVELEGSETELDKTVLEAISEPLAHLVRNSVDHGIESAATRAAAGKPLEGRITLSASHQAGHVVIDIADDGGGINVARVKRKAIEKGLITEQQAERMLAQDAIKLVFAPGFSTAEKVTNISGRGVGMDVVRTNIERIGGSVDILSNEGVGATCRVRLPLTLAIVPALIVASAGQRFAMPQLGLQELVRLRRGGGSVEHVHGAPVYRLRGRLLPLMWLSEALGLRQLPLSEKLTGGGHVLVLQVQEETFGLVVDEVTNSEEIVVKPIADLLAHIGAFAGTTILGDGEVALILDATNLIAQARTGELKSAPAHRDVETSGPATTDVRAYVLCEFAGESRVAVPLDQVERLEKFETTKVESREGRAALQYREQIIPLFRMEDGMEGPGDITDIADPTGLIHTLIHREGTRRVGLAVRRILDVVALGPAEQRGEGMAVFDGRLTTLADLSQLVQRLAPAPYAPEPSELEQAS